MTSIRANAVLAGGTPLSLVGDPVRVGQKVPDFETHQFSIEDGITAVHLADTPRTVRLFSVVPSLDTSVCADQTRRFNRELATP